VFQGTNAVVSQACMQTSWPLDSVMQSLSSGAQAAGLAAMAVPGVPPEPHHEVYGMIETQVAHLLEQARHDTEAKVKIELKQIRDAMVMMDQRLDQFIEQLDSTASPGEHHQSAEGPLEVEVVGQILSKLEQQWGQEIRALKQEIHQTILAHNHNADLIKHHKGTIDALRDRCSKRQAGNARTLEIQRQLLRLNAGLQQQQKQRALEPLFERLQALEQHVVAATQNGSWRCPGLPPMAMLDGAGGVSAEAPKPAASSNSGGNVHATLVGTRAQVTGEKAAYKCPTDAEVQARLSLLSLSAEAHVDARAPRPG